MATTSLRNGFIKIPQSIDRFIDGEEIYCYEEHGSHRKYLSRHPLRIYIDSDGINRSPELLCSMTTSQNRIKLPEDVIKDLFE